MSIKKGGGGGMKVNYTAFQKRKEKEYTNFFRSLLLFLIHSIEEISNDKSIPAKVKHQLEFNLVNSISILWNMYMIMFTTNTLDTKSRSKVVFQNFDEKYSRVLVPLIQQLIKDIEKYYFINKQYKFQSVKMLKQILQFHFVDSNEDSLVHLDAPPSVPWLASLVSK